MEFILIYNELKLELEFFMTTWRLCLKPLAINQLWPWASSYTTHPVGPSNKLISNLKVVFCIQRHKYKEVVENAESSNIEEFENN